MTESRKAEIEQALRDVAVDGVVPFGTDARIAHEYGRTRERVRQIRKAMGLYRGRMTHYGCAECGKPFAQRTQMAIRAGLWKGTPLCNAHKRYIPVACDTCGKLVRRDAKQYVWRVSVDSSRYTTGMQFCSHKCHGAFAGKAYGWANPEHPIHKDRRTHCANGHEYTPENTVYHRGVSGRVCLTCRRARNRARMARVRASG